MEGYVLLKKEEDKSKYWLEEEEVEMHAKSIVSRKRAHEGYKIR